MRKLCTMMSVAAATLGLAACGGGGGGGGSPAPVASPTPPVAAAPTTNSSLASLTVSQSFPTIGAGIGFTGNANGTISGASIAPAALDSVSISYNAATQGYSFTGAGASVSFAPSDVVADGSTTVRTYRKVSGATTHELVLPQTQVVTGGLVLSYVSFGGWSRTVESPTTDTLQTGFFVYGIPTAAGDLPRTGFASYSTTVGGMWITPTDLRSVGGSSIFTADFGAGTTNLTMALNGTSAINGATYGLGTFSGAGVIRSDAAFSGGLAFTTGANPSYSGAYAGRFFGPGATEMGAAFHLSNGSTGLVEGIVVGKR